MLHGGGHPHKLDIGWRGEHVFPQPASKWQRSTSGQSPEGDVAAAGWSCTLQEQCYTQFCCSTAHVFDSAVYFRSVG